MLKKTYTNRLTIILGVTFLIFLISSCKKTDIVDATYPDQKIYMPAAAVADGGANLNQPYFINSVATPDRVFRYEIKNSTNRFNVPLGVYRSGASLDGAVNVTVSTPTDTIGRLITSGKLTNTIQLPADKFTIQPTATIGAGANFEPFTLSVDLPYLLANLNVMHAVAVRVSGPTVASNVKYSTTVVVINPSFLIPTASFTATANAVTDNGVTTRTAVFNNTSTNGVTYLWNFGDGSPAVTTKSPSRVYAAAGTYNVTLTTVGAVGTSNQVSVTNMVIVP